MPIGKSGKDIFAGTDDKPKTKRKATAPPGPRRHAEKYTKATIVLFDRQLAFLDHLAADVKLATGKTLKRAEVIRGLVDALEAAKVSPESLSSEDAVRKLVTARLKGK